MKVVLMIYAALMLLVGCKAIAGDITEAMAGDITEAIAGAKALGASPEPDNNDNKAIAAAIAKHAKAARIERAILSCVLKVESNYRMGVISDTDDYGIAQINSKTARMYNLDLVELLTNADYAIAASARILKDYRRAFKSAEINTWVARYNIGYQSLTATNIGGYYVAYNAKVYKCVLSGNYL